MDHIKFQRGVELWGEGFLFQDKIRWDEGIDHAANGGSGASETFIKMDFSKKNLPLIRNGFSKFLKQKLMPTQI